MTLCKNCAQAFEGNYCPECGQKASTKRFSTRILFSELIDKVFPLDRGVLYTSRRLLTAPGAMLREYLAGKRAKYTKPFQYLLIMVAISLIFFSQNELEKGMQVGIDISGTPPRDAAKEMQQKMSNFIASNMTLLIVGMLPFLAMMAGMFYRKRGLNFAEHFVINCYFMAGSTLVGLPIMLAMRLMGKSTYAPMMSAFFGLVYLGYCVWGYIGFFREHNRWGTGIKAIAIYLIGYLIYLLFAMIICVLGVMAYFLIWGKS